MTITDIAKVAHEANRIYCSSIGDNSQPHWENAAVWQQNSAIVGVMNIHGGFVTEPKDSHDHWLADKIRDGWTWGTIKDPATKTHPCLVAWEELPPEQKLKDVLFFNLVKTLLDFPAVEAKSTAA